MLRIGKRLTQQERDELKTKLYRMNEQSRKYGHYPISWDDILENDIIRALSLIRTDNVVKFWCFIDNFDCVSHHIKEWQELKNKYGDDLSYENDSPLKFSSF